MKTWTAVGLGVVILAAIGCAPMSESVHDAAAGRNGGFEIEQAGLPVNWIVYSPETVEEGEFSLSFDRTEFREGLQSLQFSVAACSAAGGWHSPGLAQEFPAPPGDYDIRFWIKNEGCDYIVTAGGVTAKTGEYETVDASDAGEGGEWRQVLYRLTIPPQYDTIRFELSIRSPGDLWIDGLTIQPASDATSASVAPGPGRRAG